MHARQIIEPWYWTLLGCPTLALTNQRRRLGRRTGCVPSRNWVRHTLTSRTICNDRCQGCTASFARHARRLRIHWTGPRCLMPRLPKGIKLLWQRQLRVARPQAPRGTAWQPRTFKDPFMRVPVWLGLLEERYLQLSRSEYKGKG